jgi:D-hexose-6-phosphate mutarotase
VRLPDGSLPVGGPMNLAVRGARGPVILDDGLGGRLEICCDDPDGFDSLVVWNPGPEHDLEDVPPGGDRQFVRVEPARLATVCVEPQGVWSASVRLTALVP